MTKEQASIEPEKPKADKEISESRKQGLTDTFVALGHPAHEADRAFAQAEVEGGLPEDDLDALNVLLTGNGYAAVMPEDIEALLNPDEDEEEEGEEEEAKAKKAQKAEAKAEKKEAK